MPKLRPTVTVEELNQRSGENLPGLMGVEMLESPRARSRAR